MPAEAPVIPLLRGNPRALKEASRGELLSYHEHYGSMKNEWLKRQIVENNRIDILATVVLGYDIQPFHLAMLRWQFVHPESLQLVFRGAGKSTVCTITKCIHYLCKDRNLRILIASKSTGNSQGFLKEIKGHLEENQKLIDIFGPFYDPREVPKWDDREIEVLGRTKRTKESTITCVGVDGTIVSKHYDIIMSDDLVDEDNSRTEHVRGRTRTWYYQTLLPTLEPPDPRVQHRGDHHHLGTRYHYDDLWGHLQDNELKDHTQIIRALDDEDRSPWPEKYPPKWFKKKKKAAGTIIFNAQYQNDTEAMKGEIFQYDDCQQINDDEIPTGLRKFMGVDLAISEKEKADKFAMAVIGVDKADNIYVLDYYEDHLRFADQTKAILRFYRQHDPIRCAIETNQYQEAQYQTLKDEDKRLRLKSVKTIKDKVTRAWKLSAHFEDKRMFFRKNMGPLIDALVLFPSFRYKDGFDALDLAVGASKKKRKRRRRSSEPGVL
jgi:predicted phage terminase large subunit-like protein